MSRKSFWLIITPLLVILLLAQTASAQSNLDFNIRMLDRSREFTTDMAWGDLDGDGDLDLVIANIAFTFEDAKASNGVLIYKNDGRGNLSKVWTLPGDVTSVALGDVDGDGDLDLAIGYLMGEAQLYRNDGGTEWVLQQELGTQFLFNAGPSSQAERHGLSDDALKTFEELGYPVVCFEREPNPDPDFETDPSIWPESGCTTTAGDDVYVYWERQNGFGHLQLGEEEFSIREDDGMLLVYSVIRGCTRDLTWGDVNDDGELDLAVRYMDTCPRFNRFEDRCCSLNQILIYQNNGGVLTPAPNRGFDPSASISSNGGTVVLPPVPDEEKYIPTLTSSNLAWGDMDNDGDLDLAAGAIVYENDERDGYVLKLDSDKGFGWDGGGQGSAVAWGDLDGDGDLDLALGATSEPVQVYENVDGEFKLDYNEGYGWISDQINQQTTNIAWGDMDNDGDLDLAVSNRGERNRSDGQNQIGEQNQIYENVNGTLILDPTAGFGWHTGPDSQASMTVAWADIDGDGHLDLSVGNGMTGGEQNQIYHNNGSSGLILLPNALDIDRDNSQSVAWGDMDGDDDLDLAVGNHDAPNRVFENVQGVLRLYWESSIGTQPTTSIAWGDMDGDDDLDLAVGYSAVCIESDAERCLRYEGIGNQVYENDEGTFKLEPNSGFGWQSDGEVKSTNRIAWGDIDSDNDLDLAVANVGKCNAWQQDEMYMPSCIHFLSDNQIYLNENGRLSLASGDRFSFSVGSDIDQGMSDFNTVSDDECTLDSFSDDAFPQSCVDDIDAFSRFASSDNNALSLAWGDMDSDGDLDLAVDANIYENDQNDGFKLKLDPENGFGWHGGGKGTGVAWGDIDNDNDLDLAVVNTQHCDESQNFSESDTYNKHQIFINDGGKIKLAYELRANFPQSVADDCSSGVSWGDADGDGDLDLAIGASIYENDENDSYKLKLDPDNGFGWQLLDETSFVQSVAWGDVDDNGYPDIALAQAGRPNRIFMNSGGTFTPTQDAGLRKQSAWNGSKGAFWGDIDADGDLDLALGAIIYGNDKSQLTQLPENDDGWDTRNSNIVTDWADMDGDGDLDLAVGYRAWEGNYLGDLDLDFRYRYWYGNSLSVEQNQIYRNDGENGFTQLENSLDSTLIFSVSLDYEADLIASMLSAIEEPNQNGLGDGTTKLSNRFMQAFKSNGYPIQTHEFYPDQVFIGEKEQGRVWRIFVPNKIDGTYISPEYAAGILYSVIKEIDRLDVYLLDIRSTHSIAWGDIDGDGDLDLAVGNGDREQGGYSTAHTNQIYENLGNGKFRAQTIELGAKWLFSVEPDMPIFGIRNEDTFDDFSAGDRVVSPSDELLEILSNNGHSLPSLFSFSVTTETVDLKWRISSWFENSAFSIISEGDRLSVYRDDVQTTNDVAWGDIDNDGDLDLAVGNATINQVFKNNGKGAFTQIWESSDSKPTNSLSWGDMDGDGDLDLAVGNADYNQIYENDGSGSFALFWESTDDFDTVDLQWGDVDGDSDLDLVIGNISPSQEVHVPNQLYRNDGNKFTVLNLHATVGTSGVAWGDMDNDGDLDLAIGDGTLHQIYRNGQQDAVGLPNHSPSAYFSQPPGIVDIGNSQALPITYKLFDEESDPVGRVELFYSINGSGDWIPAAPTTNTQTFNLAASPYPTGTIHGFDLDLSERILVGRSDSVTLRLVAYEQPLAASASISQSFSYSNSTPGPFQRAFASVTTPPFRVRGTQIRVMMTHGCPANQESCPAVDAMVYRLQDGRFTGANPLSDSSGQPYRTDSLGYLQGQEALQAGDRLVALLPMDPSEEVSFTSQVEYYWTSAQPLTSTLDMTEITSSGSVTLTVQPEYPLLLFNLVVSLEWDYSTDDLFMIELDESFKRASEILYDVTNGQAAIGRVDIVPAKSLWNRADILIYATNDVRPSAAIGGLVNRPITETVKNAFGARIPEPNAYVRGQIRMGVAWDPFGENTTDLGEQWGRTLAHELSHYLFFLPDNYIGLKPENTSGNVPQSGGKELYPTRIDCQGSFMTISRDPSYSEFLHRHEWEREDNDCLASLAEYTTGRSDWETIIHYYGMMNEPDTLMEGPNVLPLNITKLFVWYIDEKLPALPTRYFDIRGEDGERDRRPNSQVYLYQTHGTDDPTDDMLLPLGSPTSGGDRIRVRGAQPGDRLCLYDLSQPDENFRGCIDQLSGVDVALNVKRTDRWLPKIQISAETTRTLNFNIPELTNDVEVGIQIFPANYPAVSGIAPTYAMTAPSMTITLPYPTDDLYIRLWQGDPVRPAHEIITRHFVSLPWQEGDSLEKTPEFPLATIADRGGVLTFTSVILGGGNQAIAGGGNQAIAGGGNQAIAGGGNQAIAGGGNQAIAGGANQAIAGGGNQAIAGGGNQAIAGGGNQAIAGGGNQAIAGGGNQAIAGGANRVLIGAAFEREEFTAPILSPDGQITIFSQGGLFAPNGIESIQTEAATPSLEDEPWLHPIGETYLVKPQTDLDYDEDYSRSISFSYLQRDVPPGYEHSLKIYFLAKGEEKWERLDTRQFIDNRLVSELRSEEGHYSIMSTIELPKLSDQRSILIYPLPDCRLAANALKSINNYSGIDRLDHHESFEREVDRLEFGQAYIIRDANGITPFLSPPRYDPDGVLVTDCEPLPSE